MSITLITGGARSGKSARAEALALAHSGRPVYIATAEAGDEEMKDRIAAHRSRRRNAWDEIEEPLDLVRVLDESDGRGARLVDCLTLWLSNHMLAGHDWRAEASRLCAALERQSSPVILVTSEVGLGIVPDNELARAFRDAAGTLNQEMARVADRVELVVSGLPILAKSNVEEPLR